MIQAHRQRHQENAEAQTWKQQSGSLGHRTRLHGNELRLRSGCTKRDRNETLYHMSHALVCGREDRRRSSENLSENAQASLRTIRWIMAILIQASLVRGLIS